VSLRFVSFCASTSRLMRRSVGSMIAVMTMNIGYFLSVLGGIFLGAFVAGRVGTSAYHH
jgi:hypothetical protein